MGFRPSKPLQCPLERPGPWLTLLLMFEAAVFYLHVWRDILPNYPRAYDQLTYLISTHTIVADVSRRGAVALLQPWLTPLPTGITYPLQGALLALLFGVSRMVLLSINLAYYLAAQVAIFVTLRRRVDVAAGWMALALFIGYIGLFRTGGLTDYRIDFAAMCLYGIWICMLVWTDHFTSRAYSVLAGCIGAALVLMRFITAAYVGPLLAILLVYLVARRVRGGAGQTPPLANFLICASVTAVPTLAGLLTASDVIKGYYVAGHAGGEEPGIRAAEFGVNSLIDAVLYYPKTLFTFQIGLIGAIIIVTTLAAAIITKLRRPTLGWRQPFDAVLYALSAGIPVTVLSCLQSKSPVVIGIVLIPLTMLIGSLWRWFAVATLTPKSLRLITAGLAAVGICLFTIDGNTRKTQYSAADQGEIERLNVTVVEALSRRRQPSFALDRQIDFLNGATVTYYWWKTLGPPPPLTPRLAGIFAVSREEALAAVAASDVVVLSDKTLNRGTYPFETSIQSHWDALDDYARARLTLRTSATIEQVEFRVYIKPDAL